MMTDSDMERVVERLVEAEAFNAKHKGSDMGVELSCAELRTLLEMAYPGAAPPKTEAR